MTLGKILSADSYGATIITSTGYMIFIPWDGVLPPAQLWYSEASCQGTAYLNSGDDESVYKIYGKTIVYSGSLASLMVPASVDPDGTSSSGAFATLSIDNPNCQPSGGTNGGWELTPISAAAAGLPDTIATPLSISQ